MIAGITAVSYYLYNKGPLNVQDSNAIRVKAIDLYNKYIMDSSGARKKYTNNIVEVDGEITGISLNIKQQQVFLLKTATSGAAVNCTLESPVEKPETFNIIKLKGICSGLGQGDPDLGIMGDVYLSRCYLVK